MNPVLVGALLSVEESEFRVGPAEGARFDVRVGERHPRIVLRDPVRLPLDHRAVGLVDDCGFGAAGCAFLLDDEVRADADLCDWSEVGAAFGEPWPAWWRGFGCRECGLDGGALEPEVDADGLVVGELLRQVCLDGAEACRVWRQLVHAFDSRMVCVNSNQAGRYHLTVTGPVAVQGWWGSEETARDKFKEWVGDWGKPGARVTLVDEETGAVLTTWPEGP